MDLGRWAEEDVNEMTAMVRALPDELPAKRILMDLFVGQRPMVLAMYERKLAEGLPKVPAAPASPVTPAAPAVVDRTAGERTSANLAAIEVLAAAEAAGRSLTPEERATVLRYSGWGGLSIEKVASRVPRGWLPESRGLVHEYYTPSVVAGEVARVVRPLLPGLEHFGRVRALEPAAGIGRFIQAMQGPGFENVHWTAVEWSKVSARMLAAAVPGVQVHSEPFEAFVTKHPEVDGQLDLLVSNPPYGQRGGSVALDRPYLAQDRAYFYFLERGLQLLRAGGLGVFLVPYGFLSGKGKEYRRFREHLLLRAHLACAYRLPSDLFPGAKLVTDLLFFRGRGGTLEKPSPADAGILEGNYFAEHPEHILGLEVSGDKKGDDKEAITAFEDALAAGDEAPKPRWGYQVERRKDAEGRPEPFRLPGTFAERPICFDCALKPAQRAAVPVDQASLADNAVQAAAKLGKRLGRLQAVLARGDDSAQEEAKRIHGELLPALRGWAEANGAPRGYEALMRATAAPDIGPSLLTFIQAFSGAEVIPGIATLPPFTPRYGGSLDDIEAQARWLYGQRSRVTLGELTAWHRQQGGTLDPATIEQRLLATEWAYDLGELLPPEVYYSGYLWPKYDRALADPSNAALRHQAARLKDLINPVPLDDIAPDLRSGWIPENIVRAFASYFLGEECPPLERKAGSLTCAGIEYIAIALRQEDGFLDPDGKFWEFSDKFLVFLGAVNDTPDLFKPPVGDAKDLWEARLNYRNDLVKRWGQFLDEDAEVRSRLWNRYNRLYRGYIAPKFNKEPLHLARWGANIKLNPWQDEAAQSLVAARRGLLCFTVGVGKTFSGCAIVAKARQEGWARRPIVLVPNNLLWNWKVSFSLALPDYNVGIIGAERYVGKNGQVRERTDTAAERAKKWQAFQRGEYDVLLLTYSMLRRTELSRDPDPIVAELVSVDDNLAEQLQLQAKTKLRGQLTREKTRAEQMKIAAGVVEAVAGQVYVDADLVLNFPGGVAGPYPTAGAADQARREKVVEVVGIRYREAEADKKTKTKKKKGPEEEQPHGLPPVWRRVLVDAGFLALDSLTALEIAEEREITERQKQNMSERARAVMKEARFAFAARFLQPHKGETFDPDIYFDELGVDLLIVDEIQNMKNRDAVNNRTFPLMYLGAVSQGSDLAWQLYFRSSTIRRYTRQLTFAPLRIEEVEGAFAVYDGKVETARYPSRVEAEEAIEGQEMGRTLSGGGGIFGLSGTPVKNSPLELYVQMTYVAPDLLRRVGVRTVYQFMARYLETEPQDVITPAHKLVTKAAVVGFKHLDELRGLFYGVGIYKTPQDVGLKVPEAKPDTVAVQKTEVQAEKYRIYQYLYHKQVFRPYLLGLQMRMQMVGIHEELDGASLIDLRELVATLRRLETPRLSDAERDALEERLRQQIDKFFTRADSTDAETDAKEGDDDEGAETDTHSGRWTWDNAEAVKSPHSPKIDACIERVLARPGCAHIVFTDKTAPSAVHKWIRRAFINRGMPADRIAILNGRMGNLETREKIAVAFTGRDELRDGEGNIVISGEERQHDVLITNYSEGMNLQRQTCVLHHLDLPWDPATLEQRNGRGVRQGNENAAIEVLYYIVTRSMDVVRLQQIQGKAQWTDAMFRSGVSILRNPLADKNRDAREFMSEDPEAERRKILEETRAKEREIREQQAWSLLHKLYLRARDVGKGQVTDANVDEARKRIAGYDPRFFPHQHLVPIVEREGRAGRTVLFFAPKGILWEGARYAGGPDAFEIGRIWSQGEMMIGYRGFGRADLGVLTVERAQEGLVNKTTPEGWQQSWDEGADIRALHGPMEDFLRSVANNAHLLRVDPIREPNRRGHRKAALMDGSSRFRDLIWGRYGERISDAIRRGAAYDESVAWPALDRQGRLVLLRGQQLYGLTNGYALLPFTDEGWRRFFAAAGQPAGQAPEGTPAKYTFMDLQTVAWAWWRSRLPQNILARVPKPGEAPPAAPKASLPAPTPAPEIDAGWRELAGDEPGAPPTPASSPAPAPAAGPDLGDKLADKLAAALPKALSALPPDILAKLRGA